MKLIRYCLVIVALAAAKQSEAQSAPPATANAPTTPAPSPDKTLVEGSTLLFEFTDRIKLPQYTWPRTLLSYPVRFEGTIHPDQLRLTDSSSGKEVPFQLSSTTLENGSLKRATVNFFSNLPSGGRFDFQLSCGPHRPFAPEATLLKETGSIVLDAGRLKVRIPNSIETPVPGQKIPGPVMALRRDDSWIGDSLVKSPSRKITSLKTEVLDQGPLFLTARMTYTFESGGIYTATLRAISGYEFLELQEEMQGLRKEDGIIVENAWTGFHADRYGKVVLGKPKVTTFRGEDPAFDGPTRIEDPEKELLVRMEITPSNGGGGRQEVSFSDDKAGRELGFFIQDVGKWNDREYAIWVSHNTLFPVFRYASGSLFWDWPLIEGTRATGIAYLATGAETPSVGNPDDLPGDTQAAGKGTPSARGSVGYLRHLYGDTSLNRVKDWILDYPQSGKIPQLPLTGGKARDLDAFEKSLQTSSLKNAPEGEYGAVSMRDLYGSVLPDFLKFRSSMSKEQLEQGTALLLFCAYYMSEEAASPMKTMLGGHPNFMSDMKFPLIAMSAIFPDHPMAPIWRDQYDKFLDLVGRFNTRPPVPFWEAKGGRWTESLATYNWAFLHPALLGNNLGTLSDGRNRLANGWFAMMGDYLLNTVTAPVCLDATRASWPAGTPLTPENGFQRIHPPQGAHAGKRGNSENMRLLAGFMTRYRPLLSEYLLWASQLPPRGAESSKSAQAGQKAPTPSPTPPPNTGTNPHLRSVKYTGYGIVMRSAVDTPDEISVYLQQVDKGPNYRWGYPNQNGSGDIYYYAGGKSYSGHGFEDTGDRHGDDAMYTCNTGVYKDYHYKCIGMNGLVRPFYNLGVAQFAELVPEEGPAAYSWPEYRSRSVMLAGNDYIVVYDAIDGWSGTRFVWTSNGVHDEMPNIIPIKGGAENVVDLSSRMKNGSRGTMWDVWKGGRSRMMIVTHKPDVKLIPSKKGKDAEPVHLKTPSGEDWVFQNDEWQDPEFDYNSENISFKGRAGIIRKQAGGINEMALFHGRSIGCGGVTASVEDPDLGISLSFSNPSAIKGKSFGRNGGKLTLTFPDPKPAAGGFYIDAVKAISTPTASGSGFSVQLPPGEHQLEVTQGLPEPMQPVMLRTENRSGGGTVFFSEVPGASKYRIEISRDGGTSWQPLCETTKCEADITGLANGSKVHVRAVALNAVGQQGVPASEYPLYVTDSAPPPPEGLRLDISTGSPLITWGEVLGVTEYRLYRRVKGTGDFQEVFHGLKNRFEDSKISVPKPDVEPGLASDTASPKVYEYSVSAVNGNGEGAKSPTTDTEPSSWRNWNPDTDLTFKRKTGYWRWPYAKPEDEPPLHYPSSAPSP